MNHFKRLRPSPAMIVATVALFVALGGAAYAGFSLPNNSVRSANIVNGQVRTGDIANFAVTPLKIQNAAIKNNKLRDNAVNSAKILDGGVGTADIADGGVGTADIGAGAVTPAKISGVPTARAFNSVNVNVPSGPFTAIPLNSERFDASGMHRTDVDTSRITITSPGIYLVTGNVTWEPNAAGARELNIRRNGTTIEARVVQLNNGVNTVDQSATTLAQFAAGDYVELVVRQNSGVALNVLTAPNFSPELAVAWVAPA